MRGALEAFPTRTPGTLKGRRKNRKHRVVQDGPVRGKSFLTENRGRLLAPKTASLTSASTKFHSLKYMTMTVSGTSCSKSLLFSMFFFICLK